MPASTVLDRQSINVRSGNIAPELRDRPFNPIERQIIWQRDKGICGICNHSADKAYWHADHIKSVAKGGRTVVDNGRVTHPSCNQRKSDKMVPLAVIEEELKWFTVFRYLGQAAIIGASIEGSIEALIQGYKLYKGETTWKRAVKAVAKKAMMGAVIGTAAAGFVLVAPEAIAILGSVALSAVLRDVLKDL